MKRISLWLLAAMLAWGARAQAQGVPPNAYVPNGNLYGGGNMTIAPIAGTSSYTITGSGAVLGAVLFAKLPSPGNVGDQWRVTDATSCQVGTAVTSGSGIANSPCLVMNTGASTWFPAGNATGSTPSGAAGQDLAGSYPNPTVGGINGVPISNSVANNAVLATNSNHTQELYTAYCSNPLSATGDLLTGVTSACPTNLADIAIGSFLFSGGVGAAPAYGAADVAVGSVLESGGVGALPAWGVLTANGVASTGAATLGTTNNATNYLSFGSAGATESAQVWYPSKLTTISNVSCYTGNVPGASNSYTFGLDECDLNGANCGAVGTPGNIAVTISGASTHAAQDLTNSYLQVASKTYVWKSVLTVGGSAPTASGARCSFTQTVN